MTQYTRRATVAVMSLLLSGAVPVYAQDSVRVRKDLSSVIALQGKPCGDVTAVKKLGENDYQATCSSGDRYHVFVDAAKRVVVEKL